MVIGILPLTLIQNKNLNEHLLPGLSPLGVPRKLMTSLPIRFNNTKDLLRVYSKKNYPKILIVEGARFDRMTKDFATCINKIKKIKIVLIIDELHLVGEPT